MAGGPSPGLCTERHRQGPSIAILSETQSRPVLVHLAELAAYDLGAEFCMIQLPTPPQTAPVPVNSTGTSWAIQGNRAVIEALKLCDIIVDCTVEGTGLLVVTNEHPEILERTEPRAEHGPPVQRRILDAALRVFAATGYFGASMEAIAAGVGVSKPTLYQYFGCKEQLFAAMMLEKRDEMPGVFDHPSGSMVRDLHGLPGPMPRW